jgi:murein DD-endopeptidase MepM/ murein hydrolase activator NlpD
MPSTGRPPLARRARPLQARQIYYRNGDSVKYVSVSGLQVLFFSMLGIALVAWILFVSVVFVVQQYSTNTIPSWKLVHDLHLKNTLHLALLQERQDEIALVDRKQLVLKTLLDEISDYRSHSVLRGNGASVYMQVTADLGDPRVSRNQFSVPAISGSQILAVPGTIQAINQDIYQMIHGIEMHVESSIEQVYAILNTTRPSQANQLYINGTDAGDLQDQTPLDPEWITGDQQFDTRISEIRARVAEMHQRWEAIRLMPLAKPVSEPYRVSSPFGMRIDPFTRRPALHLGIDIAAQTHSPVSVTAPGTVTFAGHRPGYGLLVEVAHSYGLTSRYAHMLSIAVEPGVWIERGEIVGRVGSTGRSTGPHLHYEIWHNGKPLNPRKFLHAGSFSSIYIPQGVTSH